MANFCEDADLVKIRPNIMGLGVTTWLDQATEATSIINRNIEARWYREVALDNNVNVAVTAYDADKVDAEQVKRVACYKTLQLAYMNLMKDSPDGDGFERNMKTFQKQYKEEMDLLLAVGINYDWDDDDSIADDEKNQPRYRRLQRV